jgi:hypothetical protein
MKYLLLILLVFVVPVVDAYSFSELVGDVKEFFTSYMDLTGSVVMKITEEATDIGTENLEEIHPVEDGDGSLCKDSDRKDPSQQGICKTNLEKFKDYCSEDKAMVMEFSCNDEDACSGSWYVCSGKCLDGACI